MAVSNSEALKIFLICGFCTLFSRSLPFVIFRKGQVPKIINYLGKVLPLAIMTALLIYCIKGITFDSVSNFIPEIVSVLVTALLQAWRKNTLLSILIGTVLYMFFVQYVFI